MRDPKPVDSEPALEVTAGSLNGPSRLQVALSAKRYEGKARKKPALRYAATEAATVTARVLRGKKLLARAKHKARRGANLIKVRLPRKPGGYRIELSATAGKATSKAKARLVVRR